MELRPSVAADFIALQGALPPHRTQCITALADGEVIGIGGFVRFPDGMVAASVLMVDQARKYRVAIHRAGLMAMALARRAGFATVYAFAQDGLAGAEAWLERLGFVPEDTPRGRVFVWRRPDVERPL